MLSVIKPAIAIFIASLTITPVLASVTITGTRVIYPAGEKEITVRLQNKGVLPALVQSWIDSGDANQPLDEIRVPFVLMPPVSRIEAHGSQTLRLMFTGDNLPADKESVFWLNVLDIPPTDESTADKNKLQMAIRSRIKIFYRPRGMNSEDANLAAKNIVWRQNGNGNTLSGDNRSPYHVNVASVTVRDATGKTYSSVKGLMIAPGESQTFTLGKVKSLKAQDKIEYTYIDDYGSARKVETTLSH
ncbi:fimbrial biogenesis chaperone [Erwinia sp. CGal63]|uniref:fimbrial biogenesis chaperone n=1 Tax=Erwinia sp. CGal63 TaxID=2919889 RepID=UPI00300A0426